MRLLASSLLVVGCFTSSTSAFQARTAGASKSTVRACSLLTKELVRKVTPEDEKALAIYFTGPPDENSLGAGGSDCAYGGITILIDPNFTFETVRKQKDWEHAESVAGVGDQALFRDNAAEWAELTVRSGSHLLFIQMDIPRGKTAAAIKPNVIALAKELLPKLK